MRRLLLVLALLGLTVSAWAQPTNPVARPCTIIAASTAQTDVQTAVSASVDGNVICVPAGTSDWSSAITVSKNNIIIIGDGLTRTVITSNGFTLTGTNDQVLGMTLPGGTNPIAAGRLIDFTLLGAGTIPTNRTQCFTSACNTVVSNGATSTAAQINAAIASAVDNTYVFLPAGHYTMNAILVIARSNVTLRGAGPKLTWLDFGTVDDSCCESHHAPFCVCGGRNIDGSAPDYIYNLTVGAQGTTTIQLGTETSGAVKPLVGDVIEINRDVDAVSLAGDLWPQLFECMQSSGNCSQASSGAPDGSPYQGMFQLVKVTSITAGTCTDGSPCTVGISPPIHLPGWSNKSRRAWGANLPSITGVGVESLQINGSNPDLAFRFATNSWEQNVEHWQRIAPDSSEQRYVVLNHATNITLQHNYYVGQFTMNSPPDEYGVDCYACSSVLVLNNIFQGIRTGVIAEMGEAIVVAYNYYVGSAILQNAGNEEGLINNHGCCASHLLFEGNDAVTFVNDNYFGNCQFCTAYRNRLWGKTIRDDFGNTGSLSPVIIGPLSRFANIVGNVLGLQGFHVNYRSIPGDGQACCNYVNKAIYNLYKGTGGQPDDANGLISALFWGNYDTVNLAVQFNASEVPSGLSIYANPLPSTHNMPPSQFLNGQPVWWVGGAPFPAMGPDVTGGSLPSPDTGGADTSGGHAYKIPARYCFETNSGSFTVNSPILFDAHDCYGI